MVTLNINELRNSSGRHIIKAITYDTIAGVTYGRETIVKGVHNNLNDLDYIVRKQRKNIIFIVAWRRVNGRTVRYRWTPSTGWQMLRRYPYYWWKLNGEINRK